MKRETQRAKILEKYGLKEPDIKSNVLCLTSLIIKLDAALQGIIDAQELGTRDDLDRAIGRAIDLQAEGQGTRKSFWLTQQ